MSRLIRVGLHAKSGDRLIERTVMTDQHAVIYKLLTFSQLGLVYSTDLTTGAQKIWNIQNKTVLDLVL